MARGLASHRSRDWNVVMLYTGPISTSCNQFCFLSRVQHGLGMDVYRKVRDFLVGDVDELVLDTYELSRIQPWAKQYKIKI